MTTGQAERMSAPRGIPAWSASAIMGRIAAALLLGLVSMAACKNNPVGSSASCVNDNECGSKMACMGGSCIARGTSHGTWAVELLPRSDSTAAPTQFASKTFSGASTVLTADAKMTVSADLPAGSALAGNSHITATLETAIPGHADLQIEPDWYTPSGAGTPQPFSLTVPASAIGQNATFRITPLPPRDAAQPPITIQVKLAPVLALTYTNDSDYVTGRLVTPSQVLQTGFAARAFEAGQLVSNVYSLDNDGGFRLNIPSEATGRPVTVDITPSKSQYTTPRFVTPTITVHGNFNLGDLTLPTVANSNLYRLRVLGPDQQPVAGAAVRVRTIIGSAASGVADFLRDGTSDMNGNVDLPLLPGTASNAQIYDVSVIPPPSSPLGVACMTGLAITSSGLSPGGAGDPPLVTSLVLPPKASLSGTILAADGAAVPWVTISATRTEPDPAAGCASSIVAPPASTFSQTNGAFQLLVDPGTYRIDYDPPAGAPVPRLTTTDVKVVTGDNPMGTVPMLAGELITGLVHDTAGLPLSFVGVRFFDVACNSQDTCYGKNRVEPILRAETHTDSDGTFRAVVPMQPSP